MTEPKEEHVELFPLENEESPELLNDEKNARPSRDAPQPLKFTHLIPSQAVAQKRLSSDKGSSQSESMMKYPLISKGSDPELECPQCELRTRCENSMMIHLNLKHYYNTIEFL
ncbi:hypothetical protein PENTCL1PPCAC_12484 [Pristionchus entomophagus]|uniref:C2H2-type domain-containing protein n=1 Tax=Pristionchus entomophagus TaxID=358040 RepID=A0AAV5TC70_9BILA|nr:hypothetical protein PENTCL1PPCAC_12484 [Pristionchus entomophagus]